MNVVDRTSSLNWVCQSRPSSQQSQQARVVDNGKQHLSAEGNSKGNGNSEAEDFAQEIQSTHI